MAPPQVTPPAKVESAVPAARAQQKTLFQSPRDPLPTTAIDPAISQPCRDLWADIRKINLGDSKLFSGDRFEVPDTSACTELPETLAMLQKAVLERCSPPAAPVTDEKLKAGYAANCQLALFYYRAQITDYMTREQNPDDISDMKVLTDKLFANFMRSPKDAAVIAKRMLDIDPDYYPAAQTLLFAHLIETADTARGNPNDPGWRTVEADIERSRKINPHDPQRAEVGLFVLAARNETPEVVGARAQQYAEAYPKSPLGPYYLAWSAYRGVNPKEGWRILEQASKTFPGDQRIRETQDEIRKNPNFYLSKDKTNSPFKANLTTQLDPSPDTN